MALRDCGELLRMDFTSTNPHDSAGRNRCLSHLFTHRPPTTNYTVPSSILVNKAWLGTASSPQELLIPTRTPPHHDPSVEHVLKVECAKRQPTT